MQKIFSRIRKKAQAACARAAVTLAGKKGDLATNTIGGIIIAVVIIGLLIAAINAFFPNFFGGMFNSMSAKLNQLW